MKSSLFFIITLLVLSYSFSVAQETKPSSPSNILKKTKELTEEQLKTWYQKDYKSDTIPGISLEKAYSELINDKKGKEVIVAILDTKLDIDHEDLKDQIWINTDEIPNNSIDDDQNGYIDDINGWDFLSNQKGEFIKYQHVEIVRIFKKYHSLFKNKTESEVEVSQKESYKRYLEAKATVEKGLKDSKENLKNLRGWQKNNAIAKKLLDSLFNKKEIDLKIIDSLLNIYTKDTLIGGSLKAYKNKIKYELTDQDIINFIEETEEEIVKMYNVDYNERKLIGDNPDDLQNVNYGSPTVFGDVPFQHATVVAGVLGATRKNNLGAKGFSDQIKIMPVVMVASGDEHDKDVSLAIKYAVDNGAKIINMSWGKDISLYEEWVNDAIKYAERKDVLLITAAGNSNSDNDSIKYYPNDYNEDGEFSKNLLVVGASTWDLDNLRATFSNYGKETIDIFAPGVKIYTTDYPENQYTFSRGTSLASPIVSGVAALIRSYYPNLTAPEVKQILMESGTSYDVQVEIEQENGTKKKVPFSQLSKSGKIVNAYNAVKMAEEMSKKKK